MNMIPKQDLIREFAFRTKFNLEYITANKKENGPYEITQLINSMMGLLVLPVEKYARYNRRALNSDKRFLEIRGDYATIIANSRSETLSGFLTFLRNSLSHGNIEFIGDRDIEAIKFWNYAYIDGKISKTVDWSININAVVLLRLVLLVSEHVEHHLSEGV